MCSPGINGGELRGQLANRGSRGKMDVKTECVFGNACNPADGHGYIVQVICYLLPNLLGRRIQNLKTLSTFGLQEVGAIRLS